MKSLRVSFVVTVTFALFFMMVHSDEVQDAPEKTEVKFKSESGTTNHRQSLVKTLFQDYNKNVNPDNCTVKFGVSLIDFKLIEEKNALESYVFFKYVWQDSRLKFDKDEHGGTNVLRLPKSQVWLPDISVYNTVEPGNMMDCWDTNVLIYPNGEVLWVPPCKITTRCKFTLNRQPYGEQMCTIKMGSWTFDDNSVGLDLYKNETTIDIKEMDNTSGFEIVSSVAEKNIKYYPCCDDPYSSLNFNMTIKRME